MEDSHVFMENLQKINCLLYLNFKKNQQQITVFVAAFRKP